MSHNIGKQQKYYLQYCEEVINLLKRIDMLEDEKRKVYIVENTDVLRSIGNVFRNIIKVVGDIEDPSIIQSIYYESENPSWADGSNMDKACEYMGNLVKAAENIIKIGKRTEQKKCLCCQDSVYFVPSSTQFLAMRGIQDVVPEMDHLKENICPNCMSNDRDRVMIYFLKRLSLDKGNKPIKVLQIAPSKAIEHWIYAECPTVIYQSVDIGMKDIKFQSKIQQIETLPNENYDYIICSSILQYEKIENRAANELIRILKPDGLCLLSMPSQLSFESNHQRQLLTDMGLIKRFSDAGFFLYQLGQDAYKDDIFEEHAVLHILTRSERELDDIIAQKAADRYDSSMELPLVSVIMSVYNHEKYVSQAIESVLSQNYENIEFLVSDDCSTDGSVDEILKYEERIDEIHLFGENGFGRIPFMISIAKGKYVAVLDSDDYWEPDKIERQVLYMETHSECGACFTGVRSINGNGEEVESTIFSEENKCSAEWINCFFHYGNSLAYSSIMIKKELFIHVNNWASNFSIIPDYIMWLNVALDCEVHLMEKDLLNYRWHGANDSLKTANRIKNQYFEENYCWLEIMKRMDNELFLRAFKAELIDPNVLETREILCEKALILLRASPQNYKLAGLFYLYELLADPDIKKIMYEKYHLGRQDIYAILNSL